VDLAYLEQRLVVEADSRRWHMLAAAFLEDRERDNRAQLAGWRVLRFTWWDIEQRPDYVASMIRAALSI
jgi:very-short-patch-repair endonuclease